MTRPGFPIYLQYSGLVVFQQGLTLGPEGCVRQSAVPAPRCEPHPVPTMTGLHTPGGNSGSELPTSRVMAGAGSLLWRCPDTCVFRGMVRVAAPMHRVLAPSRVAPWGQWLRLRGTR